MTITKNQKMLLGVGAVAVVGYLVYQQMNKKSFAGEPIKAFAGEPIKAFAGEPIKAFAGEPIKAFAGERKVELFGRRRRRRGNTSGGSPRTSGSSTGYSTSGYSNSYGGYGTGTIPPQPMGGSIYQ